MEKEMKIPARPEWNDEMIKELAVIVGKKVFDWAGVDFELEDCIETSEKILTYHINDNGYELAKEFEDELGVEPDIELVEILDGIHTHVSDIRNKYVKKWVSDNNLKLDHYIGQPVLANLVRQGEIECEIVKVYPETMQYGVWFPAIGYEKGSASRYVNSEDIIKIIS